MSAALDRRPSNDETAALHMPANIDAEQALLGAVLYDNAAFERLDDQLAPAHFFEPFHQRLFAAIETAIRKGQLADPLLLATQFDADEGFRDLGGIRYLAALVERAPPAANAPEYARSVLEMALRRALAQIGQEASLQACKGDFSVAARELIEETEGRLFTLAEQKTSQGFQTFSSAVTRAMEYAAEAHASDRGVSGLATGLIDLDAKIGGLHPSDLVIVAARPAMGKSSLAFNIAYNVARDYAWAPQPDGSRKTVRGGVVGAFSLEMSADQIAMRLTAQASGVSGDRLRKGEIDHSEFGRVRDAAMEISEIPLFIDDTGGLSVAKLAARARRLKRTIGLDLLIIDYLQLVVGSRSYRGGERVQEVSEVTQALKALAKELQVPVIALSQLSRQVENREDKKPQLADLRESGSIEQDADMVMFIYREAYYLGRLEPKEGTEEHFKWSEEMDRARGQAEIIIGKQRHGPIGTVKVSFNEDLTLFGNLAHDVSRYDYGRGRNPAGNDG
jgi:replicative DNA helicase